MFCKKTNVKGYIAMLKEISNEYYMMLFKESMAREMEKEEKQFLFDPNMKVICEVSLTELNDEFRKRNRTLFMGG